MNSFFFRFFLLSFAAFAMVYFVRGSGGQASNAQAGQDPAPVAFSSQPMDIVTTGGKSYRFRVELALTPAQQRRGLMFRKTLAPDAGMLFDYNPPRPITMWMKNTVLSLDMLFFDASGRISGIVARTTPYSQDLITVRGLTRYVLEVPAGTAERLGLGIGDKLLRR